MNTAMSPAMKKNEKSFVVILDLESDHGGLLTEEYTIVQQQDKIRRLLDLCKKEGVKLTVFVVGQLLEKYPHIVRLFQDYDCEFHCHSYSHDAVKTDSEEEIRQCKEAYIAFFNRQPSGYRAPLGKISDRGIEDLEKCGFKFDASIFPSYFPNPLKYLFATQRPHRYKDSGIMEIPSTSLSPFRLTLSLSYMKLLGYRAFKCVMAVSKIPRLILYGTHLHDFFTDPALVKRLPPFWRFIYGRNHDKGMDYFLRTIQAFKKKGYTFRYISEIYEVYKDKI